MTRLIDADALTARMQLYVDHLVETRDEGIISQIVNPSLETAVQQMMRIVEQQPTQEAEIRIEGNDGLTDEERAEVLAEWERTYARMPSPEEIAAIRARHTPKRVEPCRTCGEPLTLVGQLVNHGPLYTCSNGHNTLGTDA